MKYKLTHTLDHLLVGTLLGIIIPIFLYIWNLQSLIWFSAICFSMLLLAWENSQRLRRKDENAKWNWLGSLVDFLVANLGYYGVLIFDCVVLKLKF